MALAAESTHWYCAKTGEPRYTVIGRNGEPRNTTLRDARKLALVPSVTTIIKCAAAPALERWKLKQLGMACLTLPRVPGESEDAFLARAEMDSQEQGKKAANRGTAIHAAIEKHYHGEPDEEWFDWVKVATHCINEKCGELGWLPERSFACQTPYGHGGKTDLHNQAWLLDVKSKDGDVTGTKVWDDHAMQLAAYRRGMRIPTARCGILFVSRDQPQAMLTELPEADLVQGLAMFDALLAFWYAKTGLTQ